MALNDGQIPKLANIINSGFNSFSASTGTGIFAGDTNGRTIYTPGAFGGRVYSLMISTVTAANPIMFIYILKNGVTVMPIGVVNSATGAGTGAVKNTDGLNNVQIVGLPIDNTGKVYIPLAANEILKASFQTAAANSVYITTFGLDYQT